MDQEFHSIFHTAVPESIIPRVQVWSSTSKLHLIGKLLNRYDRARPSKDPELRVGLFQTGDYHGISPDSHGEKKVTMVFVKLRDP